MAETKTWIDVADTAVTIGLAALIGGGTGLISTWISARRQADKEYLKRKREILENILQQFDGFVQAQAIYWAELANAVYKRDKNAANDKLSQDDRSQLKTSEQKLFDAYRHLLSCRSRLLLIGESDAAKALGTFKEAADEFFGRANIDNDSCTKQFLDEQRKNLSKVRDLFYEALKDAYKRRQ